MQRTAFGREFSVITDSEWSYTWMWWEWELIFEIFWEQEIGHV